MKKLISTLVAALVVAGGLLVPQMASASTLEAEPATQGVTSMSQDADLMATGEYEYICIGADGSSWSLRVGEPTSDCHGTFLHKYINGVQVANYKLSVTGAVIEHPQPDALACVLVIAGGVVGVLATDGTLLWATAAGLNAIGFVTSCLA